MICQLIFLHNYHRISNVLSSYSLMRSPKRSIIYSVMLLIMCNLNPDLGYAIVFAHEIRYFLRSFTFTMPLLSFFSRLMSNFSSFSCEFSLRSPDPKNCVKLIMKSVRKVMRKRPFLESPFQSLIGLISSPPLRDVMNFSALSLSLYNLRMLSGLESIEISRMKKPLCQ